MHYAFIRDDYNEVLELIAMDFTKKQTPDTVSRIISLHRINYRNRTEIGTALVGSLTGEKLLLKASHRTNVSI